MIKSTAETKINIPTAEFKARKINSENCFPDVAGFSYIITIDAPAATSAITPIH
ncbi:hypothetical protein D3C87_2204790 [compost metagenome]